MEGKSESFPELLELLPGSAQGGNNMFGATSGQFDLDFFATGL